MEKKKRKYIWLKRVFLALSILFLAIQFIRPAKNDGEAMSSTDITHVVKVPDSILNMLVVSCYDCHSNHTNYPWYSYIQPIGFWLNGHIKDGKRHLNFSDFAKYDLKRKKKKLDETAELVEQDLMPLESYLIIHKDASLSEIQKTAIIAWVKSSLNALDSVKSGN